MNLLILICPRYFLYLIQKIKKCIQSFSEVYIIMALNQNIFSFKSVNSTITQYSNTIDFFLQQLFF